MENEKYIVVLEIASSRLSGVAAIMDPMTKDISEVCHYDEEIELDGCVRYGSIVNVDEVYSKIRIILDKIENNEKISPRKIKGVYIGLNPRSLHNEKIVIEKEINDETPISNKMISDLQREAEAKFEEAHVFGVMVGKCEIDGKEVSNPIGTLGNKMTISMNVIVCKKQIIKNLKMVLDRLDIGMLGTLVTPLAVADCILSEKEKQLGCMLVDHGADTTTVAIYKNSYLEYLNVLPMGSNNITRDLVTLNVLKDEAERLKKTFGLLPISDIPQAEYPSGIAPKDIVNYIYSRAGEIIGNIVHQLEIAKITAEQLPEGIIAVGRGMKLNGFADQLNQTSDMKVRPGEIASMPKNVDYKDRIQVLCLLDAVSNTFKPEDKSCMSNPPMSPVQPDVLPAFPDHVDYEKEKEEQNIPEPVSKTKDETGEEPKKKRGVFSKIKKIFQDAKSSVEQSLDETDNN